MYTLGTLLAALLLLASPTDAGEPTAVRSGTIVKGGPNILAAVGDRLPQAAANARMSVERFQAVAASDKDFRFDAIHGHSFYSCSIQPAAPAPPPPPTSGDTGGPIAAGGTAMAAVTAPDVAVAAATASDAAASTDLTVVAAGAAVAAAITVGSAPAGGADPATSEAFKLHSRPGAPRVILLDFTGHTTTGTAWNYWSTGGNPIVTPPFDMDGNRSSFSAAELQTIITTWRYVAEDYAPFDVDVTTEETDPSTGLAVDLRNRGTRVAIGGSCYDWFNSGAGGVAYVGVFGRPYYMPAFVFPKQLGGAKYLAEAISHEAGHNLGLSHDGKGSSDPYYYGHNGWAPIMGVGYYQPLSQWSKGEYAQATNTQDDLAVMTSPNNYMDSAYQFLAYRADDHGDTGATATSLFGVATVDSSGNNRTRASAAGAIERTGDVDYHKFAAAAGAATFTVALVPSEAVTSPGTPRARTNLNLRLEVFSAAAPAVPIATRDPSTSSGTFTVTLPAEGVYYAALSGAGQGADATTGYTAYASLGEYSLAIDVPTPGTSLSSPPPPAIPPPTSPPASTPPDAPDPSTSPSPSPPPSPSPSPSPSPLPSPPPTPPPDPTDLVLKVTSTRAYQVGARWRAAVSFSATVGGAPAYKRALTLGVAWTVTPDDPDFPVVTRTLRVAVNTKGTGTVAVTSPAALGRAPAATAELRLLTVASKLNRYNADSSDATATVAWP